MIDDRGAEHGTDPATISLRLTQPLILGADWPGFHVLVRKMFVD